MKKRFGIVFLLIAVLVSLGCDKKGSKQFEKEDIIVAHFNDESVYMSEVEKKAARDLFRLKEREYQIRLSTINEIIEEKILQSEAKKQDTSVDELLKKEIDDKIQIDKSKSNDFYDRFKDKIQGTPSEKRTQLEKIFTSRQKREQKDRFIEKLKKQYDIKILLSEPEPTPINVSVDDDPSLGPNNAKITIIGFADFQCPFSKKVFPTLKKLVNEYKGQIRLVVRDFPQAHHKDAMRASLAAACANEQGKFWEFHDKMFEFQHKLSKDDLTIYANEFSLNVDNFANCLEKEKYKEEVEKDIKDAYEASARTTPVVFIKGKMITGIKPYQYFKKIIEKELEK